MMVFGTLRRLIGRFRRDRGGNFMVMAGIVLAILALAVGFAVNIGQMMNARSALGSAIDAAVTSTARELTTGTATEEEATKIIKVYLDANSTGGILAANQIVIDKVTLDRTQFTLQVEAHVDVPLYFPLFGAEKTRRVSQTGAGIFSFRQIEVAMMLDVTGSMSDNGKIDDMKKAAAKGIETLFQDKRPNRPRVRVALVPYANSVNVGSLAAQAVFSERYASDRLKTGGNAASQMAGGRAIYDNCATDRPGSYQYTDDGPATSMVHRDYLLNSYADYYKTNKCPDAEIMPLTTNEAALTAHVNSFVEKGGTGGHMGVQWAWYMLSPKWSGVLAESQRPMEYDATKVGKYAILMTDGLFNLSFFDVSSAPAAYNDGKAPPRDAATTLCAAMRAKGIEIYTIGFDLDNPDMSASARAKAVALLQQCATPDSGGTKHFFQASTGPELLAAFVKIANNINKLALTR